MKRRTEVELKAAIGSIPPPTRMLDDLRARLHSGLVTIDPKGDLLFPRIDALDGESQEHWVALGSCRLPVRPGSRRPQTFMEREDAFSAIVLTVDRMLCNARKNKDLHTTAGLIVATLVKFFEYLWINGIYALRHMTPDHLARLADDLAKEGWSGALRVEERAAERLQMEPQSAKGWICHDNDGVSVNERFRQAIRTNATGSELREARRLLTKHFDIAIEIRRREISSISLLIQWFRPINRLFLLSEELAPNFEPFPDYVRLAKKLGRSPGRTRNLEVDQCADLLLESVNWVYERSDGVLSMLERIAEAIPAVGNAGKNKRTERFKALLEERAVFELAESLGSSTIKGLDLLNSCVTQLYTACFILIAVMNARRKDEVSHRKFGLKRRSLTVMSEEMQVYECEFYCEKNPQEDVPFFVNGATYKAWQVLCRLQDIFDSASRGPKVEGLFSYLKISRFGFNPKRTWFRFGTGLGHVTEFLDRAHPATKIVIGAHSFRRIYAVIFFYRFEHATLQALSYQLQHLDLHSTFIYLRDSLRAHQSERLPVELTQQKLIARDEFFEEQGKILAEVGSEKLGATIESVLAGTPYSGSFARLVLRVHAKFAARVDYSALSPQKQAQRLTEYMEGRGYFLEPFFHGDCCAGDGQIRPSSHCADRESGVLRKENASPKVCHKCPHHSVAAGHLEGLRSYEKSLDKSMQGQPEGSVLRGALEGKRRNVAEVIAFHGVRLMKSGPSSHG